MCCTELNGLILNSPSGGHNYVGAAWTEVPAAACSRLGPIPWPQPSHVTNMPMLLLLDPTEIVLCTGKKESREVNESHFSFQDFSAQQICLKKNGSMCIKELLPTPLKKNGIKKSIASFLLGRSLVSFCDLLWMMHNSSMLEKQSGLHQRRKMCITIEGFPAVPPFLQGPATEQKRAVICSAATQHSEFTCSEFNTLETAYT